MRLIQFISYNLPGLVQDKGFAATYSPFCGVWGGISGEIPPGVLEVDAPLRCLPTQPRLWLHGSVTSAVVPEPHLPGTLDSALRDLSNLQAQLPEVICAFSLSSRLGAYVKMSKHSINMNKFMPQKRRLNWWEAKQRWEMWPVRSELGKDPQVHHSSSATPGAVTRVSKYNTCWEWNVNKQLR